MVIGINTRFLLPGKMEGFGWYTHEITNRLCANHPEHKFVLFFDRPIDPSIKFAKNAKAVVIGPPARHPILFTIWFEWSIRRALKKHKVDVFFSPDGFLSLRSKVKQVITMHDLNFEHHPEDLPKAHRNYYRSYFPRFAKRADHIVTVSDYSKADIVKSYGINEKKISTIYNGASEYFKVLDDAAIKQIRERVSKGSPYFLFVGSLHPRKNVTRLIEAYNRLIEYQGEEETWPLVIVGEKLWKDQDLNIPLNEASRKKVNFTGRLDIDALSQIVGAAGIFVYVPYFEGFGIPLVEAMRCGVPIISGDRTSLPEVAGEAALYCDPFSSKSISQTMEKLQKDQGLRSELSMKGLERQAQFSWDTAAEEIGKILLSI